MTSLIASSTFYIIPILIGYLVFNTHKLGRILFNVDKRVHSPLSWFKPFEAFIIGAIIIYVLAITLFQIRSTNWIELYTTIIEALIVTSIPITLISGLCEAIRSKEYKLYLIILLNVLLSIVIYGIWRFDAPVGTTLNWDLYHHQLLANEIIKGNFDFFTSNLSDTFQVNGYSTLFHLLLSNPQLLVKTEILSFWWYVEFFHLFTTIFTSFLVGYAFSRKTYIGMFSAVLGAFIFEASGAYTSLFLIPQNLAATIGAAFIARAVVRYQEEESPIDLTTGLFFVYIFLNHIIIGFLVTAVLSATIIFLQISKTKYAKNFYYLTFATGVLFVILAYVIGKHINFDEQFRGEAGFYDITFIERWKLIKTFYGHTLSILVPIGMLVCIKKKQASKLLLVLITLGSLAIFFAPFPYTQKLYSLGRYFVNVTIAFGFWEIIKGLKRWAITIYMMLFTIVLCEVFVVNLATFKQTPSYKNISTHVSPLEVSAAEFLKSEYSMKKEVLLISDPTTMHILETLSGINSPAGAYATENTRKVLDHIYFEQDSEFMTQELFDIKDTLANSNPNKIILVVGKRFYNWQNENDRNKFGIFFNEWVPADLSPKDLEPYNFIDFVKTKTSAKAVFQNEGLIIFEIEKY